MRENAGIQQTFLLLGYLTNADSYTEIELVEINSLKRNTCLNTTLSFQNQGLVYTSINTLSTTTATATTLALNDSPVVFSVGSCALPLGIDNVDFEKDVNLSIYPNPSNDVVHVHSEYTVLSVSVYDPTGRQVVSGQFNSNNITINVSELSKGTYVLVVDYGEKTVKRKLLIE
jgi:hypothetical protein